jgi:cAMP-dependent protein kinase regulator
LTRPSSVVPEQQVLDLLGEDSEDDEADYSAEAKDSASLVRTAGPRRFSVSSESMDMSTIEERMSLVAHVPKDIDVANALYKVVSKSPLLRKILDPEQRELIVRAFAGPVVEQQGVDVIRQGENGEVFYLLEEGEVEVFIAKAGGAETKVHTYKAGDAFGQLALMYNAPRAATCRVSSAQAKLWTLDRVSFKVVIASSAIRRRQGFVDFLSHVPILKSLSDAERLLLADSLSEEQYEDGAVVCSQGDEGADLYIIREGGAVCTQLSTGDGGAKGDSQEGVEEVVKTLGEGEYFGEIALLTSKPRQATVKAKNLLKVLCIDRATFTRVLGGLDDVLKRNMEQYTRYATCGVNAAHNVM